MNDKVIFIFDKPKECCECPCFDESDYCNAIGESTSLEGIRNDCPLKPFLLGEELRKFRYAIQDERALIGFNMAVAICNKYLGENNACLKEITGEEK